MQNRHPTNHGAQNRANDYGSAVKNSLPPNQQFVASQPYQQYSRNQGQAIYAPPGTFDSGYVYMYPQQAQMAQRSYVINGQPTGIMNLSAYPYYTTQTYQTVQQQPLQPPQPQQQPQPPQQPQQQQQVQHLPQYQVTQHQSQPAKSTKRMIDIVNPTTGERINLMDVASKETATQAQPQFQRGQPQLLQQQQQSMFYHGPSNTSADHQQQHLQQQQHALSVKEQFASKVAATLQTHHHSSDVQTSGDQESPKQAIEAPQNINQEQQHHMLHQHQVQQSITVEQTLQKNVDSSNDSGKSSKPVVVECQKETTNVNIQTNSHANSMNSVEMVSSIANNGSTIISNVVEEPTQQKRIANKIVASSAQEQHQPNMHQQQQKHQQQPLQHQQGKQHKQQQNFQQQQKSNQQQQPHQPQHQQQQQQQQQTMLKTTQITVTKPVVKETSNVEAAVEDDGGSECTLTHAQIYKNRYMLP
ncbi:hypothetical protein HELRODRAFT_167549 [Helobdella robusta]|uniref:Uncharacterized protein n=1 Tax=Helobdella robusta TaxID=6412 RepID=T1EZH3_HELRO|nr:hypothetical protein HELRODRAFT_167549 [Helobdella robusta]ESO11030.1 hypothetical protein HELRODRAFT_167549 [Helobdella robusta]